MPNCLTCGRSFTPATGLAERFPGWVPKQCRGCYGKGKGKTRKLAKAEDGISLLTKVLIEFDAGPQTGIFTDGSAMPNPGPGGWGVVWVEDGRIREQLWGHRDWTTNNRMELEAIRQAVELAGEDTVTIHSDSQYAVKTLTEWAVDWEVRNWKRKKGKIENLKIIRPLFMEIRSRTNIELEWLKGHVGLRWNEYADALATLWSRKTEEQRLRIELGR